MQLEACDGMQTGNGELAVKAFELSQSLEQRWVKADARTKRQLLQIVCLNYSLDGATLVPTIRKPFDILVEGPISKNNRGDRI